MDKSIGSNKPSSENIKVLVRVRPLNSSEATEENSLQIPGGQYGEMFYGMMLV